jgi:hypothetical protein
MPCSIDPPGELASRARWEEFLAQLMCLPPDDPDVQAQIRWAEYVLAQVDNLDPPPPSHRRVLPVNRWPLNREALRWLIAAKEPPEEHLPYLSQLVWMGFDRGLPVPGRGDKYRWELELAAGELLLNPKLDSVKVMRWFVSNPNGPEEEVEQSDTLLYLLEKGQCWEEAAQFVMEWFYDRKAADEPYFS